jgi:general secretion pathway protein H
MPPTKGNGLSRPAGFTLIELLVVLAILAAGLALVLPAIGRAIPALVLRTEARAVADLLRAGRSAAIAGNREAVVRIDLDARRAVLAGGDDGAVALDRRFALRLVTAEEELAGQGAGAIRFFPDGTSTGGLVRLGDGARVYEVRVDWLTGRVSLAE